MGENTPSDTSADSANAQWSSGDRYEPYIGRWSRLVAQAFLAWLRVPPGVRWLDVGSGTGALTQTILEQAAPAFVTGLDASSGYVAHARSHISAPHATFLVGDARTLPQEAGTFDAVVSGLSLNFVPEPAVAVAEMARVTRAGGVVAAYVWDYAGQMQLIRYFWDAAIALDPDAQRLDEGERFPMCRLDALSALFLNAGLEAVETRAIDVPTVFHDFDDYWTPFLSTEAPAPAYAMSLSEERRAALRERLRETLPYAPDGTIPLLARALAVRGTRS